MYVQYLDTYTVYLYIYAHIYIYMYIYVFAKYIFLYIRQPWFFFIALERGKKLSHRFPLRIQGWPGIAGFAVGVAIVMKAQRHSSRGCAKKNTFFLDALNSKSI